MGEDVRRVLAHRRAVPAYGAGIAVRKVAAQGRAGTPVLLLHGLFDSGRGWRDLPERLARAGHPVLVPDLPGHGDSRATALSAEDMTAQIARFAVDALGTGKVRIVGHSLGAVVAAGLAQRLGAQVERLVLIAPAGLGPRLNADFLDLMECAETPAALARAMALLGGAPLSDALLASELDRLTLLRPALRPLVRSLAVNGVQQIDIAPMLGTLAVPLTAIFGLDDRIIDWRDCAALPARTAIHLVRGAGHMAHASDPALVARLVVGPVGAEQGGASADAA
jgi:pyruvate dehydrogenase E2 component (dihydrolipoamide acetyltransferase)